MSVLSTSKEEESEGWVQFTDVITQVFKIQIQQQLQHGRKHCCIVFDE